ncbi:hypothetical protein CL6EHI_151550 [Entamoeba histolytica]|uniref:Uncharacterized protein n=1 Tax=Entamoeba histolytica TaxID=5759 RepID=A0A175JDD9_ENTHI|nr:hypothetical protein CL6EHI_151550 [Entamoeba histolytica]
MQVEEAGIIDKINQETQLLNEEVKRLMASYQNEKQQCDELQKSCLSFLFFMLYKTNN